MMKKNISRLLALVLVLCMVVVCVPVRAYAEDVTIPEGYTEEEWQEYLRKKKLLEATTPTEEIAADPNTTITSVTTNEEGVEATDPTPPDASEIPEQSVTVDVPVDESATVVGDTATTQETVPVVDSSGDPTGETTEATVAVEYEVEAKIEKVEITDGEITDIEYNVSMEKTTTVTDAQGTNILPKETTPNADVAENAEAKAAGKPAPQYQVNMSVNGMKDAPTRVEHRYKETENGDEKVEYYYNADNGIDETDNTKKYFTVSGFEEEETSKTTTTLKDKVVSLWTSFLGIFHITNDAFEGTAKDDDTKDTYANLTEAAAKNDGKTVEMLRDYETDTSATIENNVNVDLNGHSYTNTSENAAIQVTGDDHKAIVVKDGEIVSNGDGVSVGGKNNKFSLLDIFHLKSNNNKTVTSDDSAAISISGSGNTVDVVDSFVDGSDSKYGIRDTSASKNAVNITGSGVVGKTGVALSNTNANISDSYVAGITGAAVAVSGNTAENDVIITSGWFESGKNAHDISTKTAGDAASVTVRGGRFNDPVGLYSYIPDNYATICHNDGTYFSYEVVYKDYIPTRNGYRFLGYTDAKGNAITLAYAAKMNIIAYAQWKAIPQAAKVLSVYDLISAKTDEKGCTTKITVKGDTAFVTVKDAKGEIVPISEVKISSVKQLQNLKIDTIEIQVDEDVILVLDIEEAKKNGFVDTIEVTLDKDTLLITSSKDTCIELNIAELKAADKPVEIQLVEGELTILLGKSSSMSVDLTKALKTGERIVVKLQSGVLKLYDKYNKPIK